MRARSLKLRAFCLYRLVIYNDALIGELGYIFNTCFINVDFDQNGAIYQRVNGCDPGVVVHVNIVQVGKTLQVFQTGNLIVRAIDGYKRTICGEFGYLCYLIIGKIEIH